jgi:hypothetical protein
MNIWRACAVFIALYSIPAFATDTQVDLAHQIEELSLTGNKDLSDSGSGIGWKLYSPLISRHQMTVEGCTITVQYISGLEDGVTRIAFDLARAVIPEASVPNGEVFTYIAGSEDQSKPSGFAIFKINFHPPYEPNMYSLVKTKETNLPVPFIRFWMEPVPDENQPRRLLKVLGEYQKKYCTFAR